MKKLCLLFTALLFLAGCNKEEEKVTFQAPSLEPGIESMVVGAAGCDTSFSYRIVNPVEDGKLSANASEDWISGVNCDKPDVISFTVGQNTDVSATREAVITLTYEYGGDSVSTAEVSILQEAAVEIDYDYELEAGYFDGLYYGEQRAEHYYCYYTWISSLPFDESGFFYVGGTYYVFDMFTTTPPEDENDPRPATGTYKLTGAQFGDMTFTMEYSRRVAFDEEGNRYQDCYWADGTLTVSRDGDVYTFEASLTDLDGKTHHVVYSGTIFYEFDKISDGTIPYVEQNLEVDAVTATGSYMGEGSSEDIMWLSLSFTDMTVDDSYFLQPPGSQLFVSAFMPYDQDGNIAEGTYTVMTDYGAANTLAPGEMDRTAQFPYPNGTYVRYYETDTEYAISMVEQGTMKVSGDASNYTMEFDFVMEGGYTIKGTYSGPIAVLGVPGPYSTLTGDYTLDLEGNAGTAFYYGDYYLTGGSNWVIEIVPENIYSMDKEVIDGVLIEIQTLTEEFSDGILSGVYKPAENDYLFAGEYLPGQMTYMGDLNGTNYIGDFGDDGLVYAFAPATSGDLNITNNGDGTYTFSFAFLDDKGYTWDGSWTGKLDMIDDSSFAPAKQIPYRLNIPESDAKTATVRENASAGSKARKPVSVPMSKYIGK